MLPFASNLKKKIIDFNEYSVINYSLIKIRFVYLVVIIYLRC